MQESQNEDFDKDKKQIESLKLDFVQKAKYLNLQMLR